MKGKIQHFRTSILCQALLGSALLVGATLGLSAPAKAQSNRFNSKAEVRNQVRSDECEERCGVTYGFNVIDCLVEQLESHSNEIEWTIDYTLDWCREYETQWTLKPCLESCSKIAED
ncbi:MAG: hypothetical protein J0M12_17360 [Deltaproteobacteria bacterium]|nr:hypothetical protein [Deltaproteobacteria bacterium]